MVDGLDMVDHVQCGQATELLATKSSPVVKLKPDCILDSRSLCRCIAPFREQATDGVDVGGSEAI